MRESHFSSLWAQILYENCHINIGDVFWKGAKEGSSLVNAVKGVVRCNKSPFCVKLLGGKEEGKKFSHLSGIRRVGWLVEREGGDKLHQKHFGEGLTAPLPSAR